MKSSIIFTLRVSGSSSKGRLCHLIQKSVMLYRNPIYIFSLIPKSDFFFFSHSHSPIEAYLLRSFYCYFSFIFFTNDRRAHAKPEHRSLVVITGSMHSIMMLFSTDLDNPSWQAAIAVIIHLALVRQPRFRFRFRARFSWQRNVNRIDGCATWLTELPPTYCSP